MNKLIKRQTNRFIEPKKDNFGNLLCLIPDCNDLRVKGKNGRKRNYCKNHTFIDMRKFTNWSSLRIAVFERDNYKCIKCSIEGKSETGKTYNLIADHIIPIALGGSEFNINNIQTLCINCNKIKTANDIKRISLQRKVLNDCKLEKQNSEKEI